MLDVRKNDEYGFYYISSELDDGMHMLFLEWDDDNAKTLAQTVLCVLDISGILIETPRGFHFIANIPMTLEESLKVQQLFRADPPWCINNKNRGYSSLRVSMKYEKEQPLRVIGYRYTNIKLKRWYEEIVQKYFDKGQPYMQDSDNPDATFAGGIIDGME